MYFKKKRTILIFNIKILNKQYSNYRDLILTAIVNVLQNNGYLVSTESDYNISTPNDSLILKNLQDSIYSLYYFNIKRLLDFRDEISIDIKEDDLIIEILHKGNQYDTYS